MKTFIFLKVRTVVALTVMFFISTPYAGLAIGEPLDSEFAPLYLLARSDLDDRLALNSDYSTGASGADVNGGSTKYGGLNFGVLHKYLGYGTLLFAAAAAATGSSGDSFHEAMGHSTAGMAALTATAGILEYADDIQMKDGFTFTNIHALLGSIATVGFVGNAFSADDDGHGGVPIASGVLAFGGAILIHF